MNTRTQQAKIIDFLAAGHRASKLQLIKRGYGTKPDTRISELRAEGHDIRDEWVRRNGTRYKRYWLARKH